MRLLTLPGVFRPRPDGWMLLREQGLTAEPAVRHRGSLGPLLGARTAMLEAHRLLAPGQRNEEVVIERGA
jgi:release factor glutamine methyltransferase